MKNEICRCVPRTRRLDDPNAEGVSEDFFQYLKQLLTVDFKRLNFVFAIGRKVDDWKKVTQHFFRGTPTKPVSLLEYKDTVQLVRLSETNQTLQWTDEAVEKVWYLTKGHPYLTQCLCYIVWKDTIDYDHKLTHSQLPIAATPENVEQAIPGVLGESEAALVWLWDGLPSAERVVASALASEGSNVITQPRLQQILMENGVNTMIPELENAPHLLQQWDWIESVDGGYRFKVELLRRWIAQKRPLTQVKNEIDAIDPVADKFYQDASRLYEDKKPVEACDALRQAIDLNPNHLKASQLLADILLAQGQIEEAGKEFGRLYNYQSASTQSRFFRRMLVLAETNPDENEQIKLYEQILVLNPEDKDAQKELRKIHEQKGDRAYESGDLKTAFKVYREMGLDEKADAVRWEINQNQIDQEKIDLLYEKAMDSFAKGNPQTAQKLLARIIFIKPDNILVIKTLYEKITAKTILGWKDVIRYLALAGLVAAAITGVSAWMYFQQDTSAQLQQKYDQKVADYEEQKERFEAQIKAKNHVIEGHILEISSLKAEKQCGQTSLSPTGVSGSKSPVSELEKGKYIVSVTSYGRGKSVMAQQEVDKLKKKYPTIGAGKVLDSRNKYWRVYLGDYYSKESANLLKEKAVVLGFKDAYVIKTNGPEQLPPTLSEFLEQFSPQEGSYIVVVDTFHKESYAQNKVDQINDKFPKLKATKYQKNRDWRVYIGDSYSEDSAKKLQRYVLIKGIVEDAYVTKNRPFS